MAECTSKGGSYFGQQFDICPVRAIYNNHKLMFALQIEREAQASPISGWPEQYAAWVPTIVTKLAAKRAARERGENQSKMKALQKRKTK